MTLILGHEQQRTMVKEVCGTFPQTFGMKGFPGQIFRVNAGNSYVTEYGEMKLYLDVLSSRDGGEWLAFGKGCVDEIRRDMTALEGDWARKEGGE